MRPRLRHVAASKLSPVIHAVLPRARGGEAHRMLEKRVTFGKVVLEP